ncbi:MAG: hypothetical protein Ct9H300mP29_2180 [Candidatus Neomarinimicrobiota bacterium]|nr:MAG: hypothetical protein Ct9H300mP29_2180 [Candidatus Neomarinimicrobiota bacterium]
MYGYKENWKFRTAWSQGFRAPSFMERSLTGIIYSLIIQSSAIQIPNLSVQGDTLGAEYTNTNKYQMSLIFYHTQFENLINDFTLKPGLLSYQNIKKLPFPALN